MPSNQSFGYSGTSLIKKLGIKDDSKLLLIGQPDNYPELIGSNLTKQLCSSDEKPDIIHLFVKSMKDLEEQVQLIRKLMKPATSIWVSWYKKSSGITTDVTEDLIRNYALQNGLVDIKVCAVSQEWSGLKLVIPVALRKKDE